MAKKFLTALDLSKNELQNAVVQNLGSAPSSPVKGQLYFNSTGGDNTLYWYDGSGWVPAKATGGAFPGYGVVPAETTFSIAKSDGAATTVARSDHTHGTPTHDNAAHSAITLNSLAVPTGTVSMNSQLLSSVAAPSAGSDAANKTYVDNTVAGLSWKEAARVATTANLTQASLSPVDGVTLSVNDRILCKDQSTASQNGIWLAQTGSWTRASDGDAVGDLESAVLFVKEGTANADKAFVCTTDTPITPGTTANAWVQFGAATTYTAGAGLTLTTNDLAVGAGTGITVAADSVAIDTAVVPTLGGNNTFAIANIFSQNVTCTVSPPTSANHLTRKDYVDGVASKRFSASVGGATSAVVNHALNTRDVVVDVYRVASPYDTIECDVERTDVNNVTLRFAVAPAASEYRCVVVG